MPQQPVYPPSYNQNYTPNPYQQVQPQYGTSYEPYPTGSNSGFSSFRKINILEIATVLISILALIGVFSWGLIAQNAINRDKQRQQDISQVIAALLEFYKNSNTIPSQRTYPIANCSESLNEVDYEYTLKRALTGQAIQLDTHAYIDPSDYPTDRSGVYSTTFAQRKIPYRCTEKLNLPTNYSQDTPIYSDGTKSCNFNQAQKYTLCYLYTSTNNGDTFSIGYYKESSNSFVVYKKFRDDTIQVQS
jgi:type II secretory pathway pseudopilin PulG